MSFVYDYLVYLFLVLTLLVLLRVIAVIFTFGRQTNPLTSFLINVTEPIMAPVRNVVPRIGVFDFTPFITVVLLQALIQVVVTFKAGGGAAVAVFFGWLFLIVAIMLTLFIVLRTLVFWIFAERAGFLSKLLYNLSEPFLRPLRKWLPQPAGLDFSPFVAVVILQGLAWVVALLLNKL